MADRLPDNFTSRHRLNMDIVERFILSGVADHILLCDRIRDHMRYTFALTEGLDEAKVFSEMPQQLRHEAFKLLRVPQLKSSSVFRNCSSALLQALSEVLLVRHYSGGDIICIMGEYTSEMFFVQRGLVEVSTRKIETDTCTSDEDNANPHLSREEKISTLPTLSSDVSVSAMRDTTAGQVRIVNVCESFGGAAMVGHQPSPIFAHA